MKTFHVVSISIGTGVFLLALAALLVVAFALTALELHPKSRTSTLPATGALGEIEHQLNDLKYGPVNSQATKEVKNGLFDRIRQNRQSRNSRGCGAPVVSQSYCSPTVSYSHVQPAATCYASYPTQTRIVERSDCNYSYVTSNPIVGQTVVTQSAGLDPEMPAIGPVAANAKNDDCLPCRKSNRNALKTGSFICSNCRASRIGQWHTEWKSDGTPVTFLCERCYSFMTPEQRERSYNGYLARQSKSVGIAGLLHQEIGQ